MIDVKFRGKRIGNNEWVYGSLIIQDKYYIVPEGWTGYPADMMDEVLPETVGQYAGFKDKNGKEVYRGDVVDFKYGERFCENDENQGYLKVKLYRSIVMFKNGEFFPHPQMVYIEHCWYSYKYFDFEVVGNIYDDPELKESKEQ